jgi:hypothetical protein
LEKWIASGRNVIGERRQWQEDRIRDGIPNGGGNGMKLEGKLPEDVKLVDNPEGIRGAVYL